MAANKLTRLAALAAMLLAAASCIYPFETEIPKASDYPIVVEGNLRIGNYSSLSISSVHSFDEEDPQDYWLRQESLWIKNCFVYGEDGTQVPATFVPTSFYELLAESGVSQERIEQLREENEKTEYSERVYFDTEGLRPDQRYQIHFETPQGGVYETDWLEVCAAPTIDDLVYNKNEEYHELRIGLSMHCNGSKYFRWTFEETWEYHSMFYTELKFNPTTWNIEHFDLGEPNFYYCWKTVPSSSINLFTTEAQTEDRFEDLAFHCIPLTDTRLQIMYKITVTLESISRGAYSYWNNIRENNEKQGSIFAPMPSQMVGNVHCQTHPDKKVFGYIDATQPVQAVLWYDNELNKFFDPSEFSRQETDEQKVDNARLFPGLYRSGHLPYAMGQEEVILPSGMPGIQTYYMWALAPCVDCRLMGGNKYKPKDWPTDHK